jgi:hypothetical protein
MTWNGTWKSDKSMKQEPRMPLINNSQKKSHPALSPRSYNKVREMFFIDFFKFLFYFIFKDWIFRK